MIEFDWDTANVEHIAEHDLAPNEVEFALKGRVMDIDYQDWRDDEERFAEGGMTNKGRVLLIVTTIRGEPVRVVAAYDAPRHLTMEYLMVGRSDHGRAKAATI